MTAKLTVGVIGCGSMGTHHVRGYLVAGRFEIAAISDPSDEVMDEMDGQFRDHEDYRPDRFADLDAMLDSQPFDVISVCVWHREHAPCTIAAATRGPKAILCEKPMAETTGRADDMRMVCERNGVKLAIAHQRRFLPSYTLARDLIADGAIGEVEMIYGQAAYGLPNWSLHHADMFRYLLDDEWEWVMGGVGRRTDQMERGTRIEDEAMGAFQFKGGACAVLLSDLTGRIYQGGKIYGTEGMIDLETKQLRILGRDTGGTWETHAPDGQLYNVNTDGFEMVEAAAAQAAEMADWVEGRIDTHRGEAQNGYRALEMVMAVYESARLHGRVELPLKTRVNPLDLMVESDHLPVVNPGAYDIRGFKLRGGRVLYDDESAQV